MSSGIIDTHARMRKSILVYAGHVDKNQPMAFYCSNTKNPYRESIERVLTEQNADRAAREKVSIEDLYQKYGGKVSDLPWS
jgi:glycyl-tRNA synthetase (class II)